MWRVEFRPEVENDVDGAAKWYEDKQSGLGSDLIDEIIRVFDSFAENPLMNSRHHPSKDIRWKLAMRFPYRIIYEVDETNQTILVAAVLHAAREDVHWRKRVL
jgi:plasmid stabilization system protein ParE